MKWMGDRWVYVTPHGILWPRSGDWIVTDQNGRATVLRDEEFQRVYFPFPKDAAGCREAWAVVDAHVRAKVLAAESAGRTASGHMPARLTGGNAAPKARPAATHGIRESTASGRARQTPKTRQARRSDRRNQGERYAPVAQGSA